MSQFAKEETEVHKKGSNSFSIVLSVPENGERIKKKKSHSTWVERRGTPEHELLTSQGPPAWGAGAKLYMTDGEEGGARGGTAFAWNRHCGGREPCELTVNLRLLSTYYVVLGQGRGEIPTGVRRPPVKDKGLL